jgi:hypothetical protein
MITVLIGMRVSTHKGVYCRQCGTALCRQQTKTTLVMGWWGIQGLAAPLVLLMNLYSFSKVNQLPQAGYAFAPGTGGPQYGRPLALGTPVLRSPALVVPVLLVVGLIALIVVANL